MFSTLMVTFREGVEAFLVAALTLTYLRQTGRTALVPAVRWGILAALVLSAGFGAALAKAGGMQPIWEAWLALFAMALVMSCTVHIMRHGTRLAGEIRDRIERASARADGRATLAVFAFVLLMVGREGVETAAMLAALAVAGDLTHMLIGGVIGVACAGLLAWAWSRYGRRINLTLFFQVTAIFMVLFSLQLLLYAVHEFTEAGAVPGIDNEYWHLVTEPYGPEGRYGAWLSYGLVLVPLAFLAAAWLRGRRIFERSPAAAQRG